MANFSELINAFTYTFTDLAQKIPEAIKSVVTNLLFDTVGTGATATTTVSNFALFGFMVLGLALIIGVTRWGVSLIRRKI